VLKTKNSAKTGCKIGVKLRKYETEEEKPDNGSKKLRM